MFDTKEYWERRGANKRGQGDKLLKTGKVVTTGPAEFAFNNEGHMIIKNRSYRRRKVKLPGWSIFTRKQLSKEERKKLRKRGRN